MTSDTATSPEERIPSNDPRVFEFLAAWKEARNGAVVPAKRNIDPTRIPRVLGFVWMYQYDDSCQDFVCRLAGEDINAAWGRNIKGNSLLNIVGAEFYPTVFERWRRVIDVPLIEYGSVMEHPVTMMPPHHTERLLLPMEADDGQRNYIFGISLYRLSPSERYSAPAAAADIVKINCSDLG